MALSVLILFCCCQCLPGALQVVSVNYLSMLRSDSSVLFLLTVIECFGKLKDLLENSASALNICELVTFPVLTHDSLPQIEKCSSFHLDKHTFPVPPTTEQYTHFDEHG